MLHHLDVISNTEKSMVYISPTFTDSWKHRMTVRNNMGADPEWTNKYAKKVIPWLKKQENAVLKCLPGTDIVYPTAPGKSANCFTLLYIFGLQSHSKWRLEL